MLINCKIADLIRTEIRCPPPSVVLKLEQELWTPATTCASKGRPLVMMIDRLEVGLGDDGDGRPPARRLLSRARWGGGGVVGLVMRGDCAGTVCDV